MPDLNHLSAQKENKLETDHELMHVLALKWHQSHFFDHLAAIVHLEHLVHDHVILCDTLSSGLHGFSFNRGIKPANAPLNQTSSSIKIILSCDFDIMFFCYELNSADLSFYFILLAVLNLGLLRMLTIRIRIIFERFMEIFWHSRSNVTFLRIKRILKFELLISTMKISLISS